MACTISLIDPTKNSAIKTEILDLSYKESEKEILIRNEKINGKPNPKGKFWKVITIN